MGGFYGPSGGGSSGGPTLVTVTKIVNTTRNSASPALAADPELTFPTIQPGTYSLNGIIAFNSNPGQIQMQLNAPSPGGGRCIYTWDSGSGSAPQSKGLNVTITDASAANDNTAILRAVLVLTVATTLTYQWTNNVASMQTTLYIGSYLTLSIPPST